jgi:hypothetical protein
MMVDGHRSPISDVEIEQRVRPLGSCQIAVPRLFVGTSMTDHQQVPI